MERVLWCVEVHASMRCSVENDVLEGGCDANGANIGTIESRCWCVSDCRCLCVKGLACYECQRFWTVVVFKHNNAQICFRRVFFVASVSELTNNLGLWRVWKYVASLNVIILRHYGYEKDRSLFRKVFLILIHFFIKYVLYINIHKVFIYFFLIFKLIYKKVLGSDIRVQSHSFPHMCQPVWQGLVWVGHWSSFSRSSK